MHKFKFLAKGMFSAVSAATVALGLTSLASATQVVAPSLTPTGASINGSTQSVGAGTTFTFYGLYSDDNTNPESGLGVKVLYNGQHLTNATITEEYTKCRIAAGQVQDGTTTTAKAVMGWIDTALRPTGVVGTATGAVGWPNLADLTSGGCLNPGNINGAANAGDNAGAPAATSGTPLKLFRFNATMAASCTSSAACSSTVQIVSDGNFSYAGGTPGFTNQSFTIQGAAASALTLAASNPIVSRKTHSALVCDVPLDNSQTIGGTPSVEPRLASVSNPHKIVYTFTSAPAASGHTASVTNASGNPIGSVTAVTSVSGNSIIVDLSGVTENQRMNVVLSASGVASPFSVPVGFLVADVNGTRAVNAGDISAVRAISGQAVSAANCRIDVNASGGTINAGDISAVRARAGATLNP